MRRKTRDLDIAIAISDWGSFDKIKSALISEGYEKSPYQAQRFFWNDYCIDIVPFGAIAKDDDNIYWPPEETIAMSVRSFKEVLKDAVTVEIDNEFTIKIVSLQGLFLLKLNAWIDRNLTTNKDADDLWQIIDNYYLANEDRTTHQEVYNLEDFNYTTGGAYWMAHDIADMLSDDQIRFYNQVLKNEISLAEYGRLVTQIIESNKLLKSEEVIRALSIISDVFSKRVMTKR